MTLLLLLFFVGILFAVKLLKTVVGGLYILSSYEFVDEKLSLVKCEATPKSYNVTIAESTSPSQIYNI